MASIKVQKLVRNTDGTVKSGSASIVEAHYDPSVKGKSRKKEREKLGKIVYINEKHTCGVFLSPVRGLVEYDSRKDAFTAVGRDDRRIAGMGIFQEPPVHAVFGDSYLIFRFLGKCGLTDILRAAFSSDPDYEKVLCHLVYGLCRNGSRETVDEFFRKSFASYVLRDVPESRLGSDTSYFEKMGDDRAKVAFFQNFVRYMRKTDPGFGTGCYVDSTPLPNDIRDNPFNALCSHGVASTSVQTRLVLVLDEATGLPVWFQIVPGNVLDLSTIGKVMDDVTETLEIRIGSLVLDAGYVSKELLSMFNRNPSCEDDDDAGTDRSNEPDRTMVARMPAKKGYPYKALYSEIRHLIPNSKYQFDRKEHTYFGIQREVKIFGYPEYAYVYVDKDNAIELARNNRMKDPEAYERLSMAEKNWYDTKFGYFVLVSNKERTPAETLDEYFGRTYIETVFKTGKEYLEILPLEKWTATRVKGKLLSDMILEIAYLLMEKGLSGTGISAPRLIGNASSLMCLKKRNGDIEVETPNKNVREFYKILKVDVPTTFSLARFSKDVLKLTL